MSGSEYCTLRTQKMGGRSQMQILNGWKLFTRLWKDFVFVDMTRTGTGKKTSGGSRDTPGRTPTRAHGSHRRTTSQPSKPTNPRPSGCGPRTVADSREATGTALATAVAAAAVAAAALAAAPALAIPALAAAAALRGAPHLRRGTAMAVAGAMPMVLAVDDSPLTQLNAELPSGSHSMPIGVLQTLSRRCTLEVASAVVSVRNVQNRESACALVCPVCVPAPPGVFLPVLVEYRMNGFFTETPSYHGVCRRDARRRVVRGCSPSLQPRPWSSPRRPYPPSSSLTGSRPRR